MKQRGLVVLKGLMFFFSGVLTLCPALGQPLQLETRYSAKDSTRRQVVLRELTRVRTTLATKTSVPPDSFVAHPEQDASQSQLEENLVNLYVAVFGLGAEAPFAGPILPRRASSGISSSELAQALDEVDSAQRWIASRLTRVERPFEKTRDLRLVIEAAKLRSSHQFWDDEKQRLIDACKIR